LAVVACPGIIIEHIQVSFGPGGTIVGGSITFSCLSPTTQDLVTYRWEFGDGNSAEGQTVTHTYNTSGNFLVECHIITTDSVLIFSRKLKINPDPNNPAAPPPASPPLFQTGVIDDFSTGLINPAGSLNTSNSNTSSTQSGSNIIQELGGERTINLNSEIIVSLDVGTRVIAGLGGSFLYESQAQSDGNTNLVYGTTGDNQVVDICGNLMRLSFQVATAGFPITVELFDDTGASLTSVTSSSGSGGVISIDFPLICTGLVSQIVISLDPKTNDDFALDLIEVVAPFQTGVIDDFTTGLVQLGDLDTSGTSATSTDSGSNILQELGGERTIFVLAQQAFPTTTTVNGRVVANAGGLFVVESIGFANSFASLTYGTTGDHRVIDICGNTMRLSFLQTAGNIPVTVELFDHAGASLTSVASNTGAGGDFSLDFALSCSDLVSQIVITLDPDTQQDFALHMIEVF
jgi:hypothetical protein